MVFSYFCLALFIIVISLIFSTIKIKILNIKYSNLASKKNFVEYNISVYLLLFNYVPILKFKVDNKKIQELLKQKKVKKYVDKKKKDFFKKKKKFNKNFFIKIKRLNIKVENVDLNFKFGIQDSDKTALLTGLINILVTNFVRKVNKKNIVICPLFCNENLINFYFSGILKVKIIHILYVIFILKNKEEKNERISNRRAYEYGYE